MKLQIIIGLFIFTTAQLKAQQIWSVSWDSVSSFSSPRCVDLNADGVQDIVLGAGIENTPVSDGIMAINGKNGNELWRLPARNQMYGSAIFQNISADTIPEVFICGRDAQLYAINGTSGYLIWEFWPEGRDSASKSGWYNFYNPQWIADQDNDGFKDLLISNGGNAAANSQNDVRYAGKLMIISAVNGNVLYQDTMPDGRETYFSPLLLGDTILLGSGGETKPGKLWMISIDSFKQSGLRSAKELFSSTKGFIAAPSLADITGDGKAEIFIPQLDKQLTAYSVTGDSLIWSYTMPDCENYVSPAIGYFNGDNVPDVACVFAKGVFPFYTKYYQVVLDGATGSIIALDSVGSYQLCSPLAVDLSNDGIDELVFAKNYDAGFSTVQLRNEFVVWNIASKTLNTLGNLRVGTGIYAMPTMIDLDANGKADLIYVNNNNERNWYNPAGFSLARMELEQKIASVSWPAYLGRDGDGYFRSLEVKRAGIQDQPEAKIMVYPNPSNALVYISGSYNQAKLYNSLGTIVAKSQASYIDVSGLSPGVYILQVQVGHVVVSKRIICTSPN